RREPRAQSLTPNSEFGIWNLECVSSRCGKNSKFQLPNSKFLIAVCSHLSRLRHARREHLEQAAPPVWRIDCGAHGRSADAVTLEVPVLEVDARASARLRREPDVDFTRLRELRLVPPLVRDLPCEHQAARRVPHEHAAPVAVGAVLLLRVAAPAGARFD